LNGGHLGFQNGGIWTNFLKMSILPFSQNEVKMRVHFSAHGSLPGSVTISTAFCAPTAQRSTMSK